MAFLSTSDFRDAARSLWRAPTLSISAILCLGLGLGATTAISSAIDRAVLQPLPFRDPGALVTIYRTAPQANNWPFSAPNFTDLARTTRQLAGMSAIANGSSLLVIGGDATQVTNMQVSGNL